MRSCGRQPSPRTPASIDQRRVLSEFLSAQPLPADVTVREAALGGVRTAEITVDGIEPRHVVLYFHGGMYVTGDPFLAAALASQVGRRTSTKVMSEDFRLAPSTRIRRQSDALAAYECLLDGGTDASDIAFAGESARDGLASASARCYPRSWSPAPPLEVMESIRLDLGYGLYVRP